MNNITPEARAMVYADAQETFGANAQLVKALEELSEVQLEIFRVLDGRGSIVNLAEEVADATIMLEQVRRIFGIDEMTDEIMDRKILRLRQRIEAAHGIQHPNVDAIRELFGKMSGRADI